MTRLLFALFLVVGVWAQNPNTSTYPVTAAGDQALGVAVRLSESTLSATITSSTLTVTVADGARFVNHEIIRIDNEEMLVCTRSSNTLTICSGGRGFNGTTAAAHTSGTAVRGIITSHHHNQLAAEIKAMQAELVPILFASFPSTCVANVTMRRRSDPATPGQDRYVCNASGNGWVLAGDGGVAVASAVAFTPFSTLASTNVQNAIQELLAEAQALDAEITAIAAITPSDDVMLIANGTTWQAKTLPNCNAATHKTHYNAASNTWTCETDLSGVGGGSNLRPDNEITTVTYTLLTTDCDKHLILNRSLGVTLTLPDPASFSDGCWFFARNIISIGSSSTIVVASGISLNGTVDSTMPLSPRNSVLIVTDGTGWRAIFNTYTTSNSGSGAGITPAIADDGSTTFSLSSGVFWTVINNASSGGTTNNHLAKLNSSGEVLKLTTSDTYGAIGVVTSGAGTAGSASVQVNGYTVLQSEGNTTAGHYVGISATTAGAGTSLPSCPDSGQVLGVWVNTGTGAGVRSMLLKPNICGDSGSQPDSALWLSRITGQYFVDHICVPTSSSPTDFVCSLPTAMTAYQAYMPKLFIPNQNCTGNTTTTIDMGAGAKRLYQFDGTSNPTPAQCATPVPSIVLYDPTLNSSAGGWRIASINPDTPNRIGSGTATLGTSAISSGACASAVTVSATGVATTDSIVFTPNADISGVTGYAPVTTGGLVIYPYPTSNNVNFKVCNPTSSSITPGAVTLNWRVVR